MLFVGKGGVGKTTLAAATAVALSEQGKRVLIVSTDQAHSLADAFGSAGDTGNGEIWTVTPGLDALHINTLDLVERKWRDIIASVAGLGPEHRHGVEWFGLEPEELTGVPGVEELLALGEVARYAEGDSWDVVVVDCAPTAETLRLVALPESVMAYVDRVWPQNRRLQAMSEDSFAGIAAGILDQLTQHTRQLRDLLTGDSTLVRLVVTPERIVFEETRRTVTAMSLLGMTLDRVIANRVLVAYDRSGNVTAPTSWNDDPIHRWYRDRVSEQVAVIDELTSALGDIPLLIAGYAATEPVGVAALGDLARNVDNLDHVRAPLTSGSPGDVRRRRAADCKVEHESGTGLDSVYLMRLTLPLVDPRSIRLGRIDDDLVVGAAGIKRRVPLAPVLRRCVVAGAEITGSELRVRFQPNPEVWPQW
ncbi:ArsA family ATPase [Hoyosella altamirensis]|uniref:Arsenite-transporting ATPase n=1 Tax=Hoyosella altamirensis TaxID=616997 RepID=A0A839RQU1_9ACTN|nr:ArsA family ATPase [Hoyosella altamirensis]MBB3038900.1 arsenite-transporting ATPase [Hoyosella altamirensis]